MANKFVLFDFDGVIADSFALSFDVATQMHPHLMKDEYIALWDGNIYEMDAKLSCGPDCKPSREDYFNVFTARRGEIGIVPGSKEMVQSLAVDHTLCVISSSISMDIMAFLERHDMAEYFSDVLGSDAHESKVEKINTILSRYEVMAQDAVFVTDTLGDMLEAEKSGIGAIGVAWGFQNAERLARGNPYSIVHAPADLPGNIAKYFAKEKSTM